VRAVLVDVTPVEVINHCCRVCFGRLVRGNAVDGHWVYACTNCGATAIGREPASLCACGMKTRQGKDMGIRCVVNPDPTPEVPNIIIAAMQ
jgi:hypothetical protein